MRRLDLLDHSEGEAIVLKNVLGRQASPPYYVWANEDCANIAQDFTEAKRIRTELIQSACEDVYIADADGVEVVDDEIEAEEAARAAAAPRSASPRPA